jgi:hypothetical protein
MRKEYVLRGGKPNPYFERLGAKGRNALLERYLRSEHFVKIDDDIAASFPGDAPVNETLRLALRLSGVFASAKINRRSREKSKTKRVV